MKVIEALVDGRSKLGLTLEAMASEPAALSIDGPPERMRQAADLKTKDSNLDLLMNTRNILVGISLLCTLAPAARGQSGLDLPTPRDHYKPTGVEAAQRALMTKVMEQGLNAEPKP